jgi:hypothetical protein
MKPISLKLSLCVCALSWVTACSQKNESKSAAESKAPPVSANQAAVPSPLTVDAPVLNAETPSATTESLLKQRLSIAPDAQGAAPVLQSALTTTGTAAANGTLTLNAVNQSQVVQTPTLRLEARAQAMREMHWERAQQK